MSLLRRALRTVGLRFGKDRYLAGTDLEGNSFFERPHPDPEFKGEWRKNKRYVEYKVTRHLSDYNYETIPVQWSSWLRRTRREPPTLEELTKDYYRQIRLQDNVQKLEIAYKEEKLRLQSANQDALLLSRGEEVEEGSMEAGLPKNDVGIGAREAEIGKNLGLNTEKSEVKEEEPLTGEEAQVAAKERNEKEREEARKRREEFARSAPPTGNPSDSFQPEGWQPSGPARRR
ncbi:hypothetical protein JCM5353_003626 [Sporobolomyces roseus]